MKIIIIIAAIVIFLWLFKIFIIGPSPKPESGQIISKSEEDQTRWDYFPEERTITIMNDWGETNTITLPNISEEDWNELRVGSHYDPDAPKYDEE